MERVTEADLCTRSDLLAWVIYPGSASSCYVYPQYLYDGNDWKIIDKEAFPNIGSFQGLIKGGSSPYDLNEQYGPLVIARINKDQFNDNYFYNPNDPKSNQFIAQINPRWSHGSSELEFEELSNHPLSTELVQIISIDDDLSFSEPIERPIKRNISYRDLVCKYILIKKESNNSSCYFGPFEYSIDQDSSLEIQSSSSNDYRIMQINQIDDSSLLPIIDTEGKGQYTFVQKSIIDDKLASIPPENIYDWIPQKELTNVIIRAINLSNVFSDTPRNILRSVKSAVWDFTSKTTNIVLDDTRKKRITDWLSNIDNWVSLPIEIVKTLSTSIDESQLTRIVLDEKYYPQFRERILSSAGVQDQIDQEKLHLEQSLSAIRDKISEATDELKETNDAIADAKKQVEKIRTDALRQSKDKLEKIEQEIGERQNTLDNLNKEYENLILSKHQISNDISKIIEEINNPDTVSTKIIHNEIVRKVISTVSGIHLDDESPKSIDQFAEIRPDEFKLSDDEIIDEIYTSLTQEGNRKFSKNDVINFLICITQGFITTFSGLPGTGKTSLCNLLGTYLGLKNDSKNQRFTEINVENGWTSYKDYIGYYNPLSRTYEKSNTEVYDAMNRLRNETRDMDKFPPYFFLLDEANLSPIEHYWSPFLRACDSFMDGGTKLSLGGETTWIIPPYVRFLATVNFDHTTEALSQRFLDRSWIITLDPEFIDTTFSENDMINKQASIIPFSSARLFSIFECKESDFGDSENIELLNELLSICEQNSFIISPRSQIMMRRYIAAASRLMSAEWKNSHAPLDYAFSQKVLPQISGPIESMGPLIESLIEKSSDLEITRRRLNRMKEFGDNNGFYQYFI